MKNNHIFSKGTILGIIVTIVLLLSINQSTTNTTLFLPNNQFINSFNLSLTPHLAIEIISDINFTDYGFSGSGIENDPYIIERYNITTTESKGVYISGTTKYFAVRNCYIDAAEEGIHIYNVAYGTATIDNNTCCNNNGDGISIEFSSNSTISNNICNNNNLDGIYLYNSGSSTVTNNTCNYNSYGIDLSYSGSSTVSNNTCCNNGRGIEFYDSGSSTVANNTCNNNENWGISLWFCGNLRVENNTFTNCGLYIFENTISAYLSSTIENNWVNGKKLGYFTNLVSSTIAEPIYGELILINCINVEVCNQTLNNATTGLYLYSCTASIIRNNTISNNSGNGIESVYSENSSISNNTINNNDRGIDLGASGSSIITKNTCLNNGYGIFLYDSGSSTLANNICNNTDNDSNIYGIWLYSCSGSTLSNNTCCNNNYRGIMLEDSDSCVVTYNLLQENEDYGVYLHSNSDDNEIHHNTFIDNNLGGTSQAYDDGVNNYWYDSTTQEGNEWSDWSGGPYLIDGSAGAFDLYPLGEPVVAEYPHIVFLTLLLPIVTLFLTRTISKKVRKKQNYVR
ncbi:MAG: NosD domain-containing protein [Candidatus Heimdallarchaeaceae archaeon]